MHNSRTEMDVRKAVNRLDDDAWGFGPLFAVIAACFVVLGGLIYFFGEDQRSQTALDNPVPMTRTERSMGISPIPPAPPEPSTTGQGGQ